MSSIALLTSALVLLSTSMAGVFAQSPSVLTSQAKTPNEQIFLTRAQDKTAGLVELAKKEGVLTLYSSMAPSEIGPIAKEFERKYGIKVDIWRSTSEGILQRTLNENKAKKSAEDQDELVTETLARIYSDQMLYHKAISTYKKLMLKFPEKSRYFADQIEQLERKTN